MGAITYVCLVGSSANDKEYSNGLIATPHHLRPCPLHPSSVGKSPHELPHGSLKRRGRPIPPFGHFELTMGTSRHGRADACGDGRSGFEPKGCEFESRRARQFKRPKPARNLHGRSIRIRRGGSVCFEVAGKPEPAHSSTVVWPAGRGPPASTRNRTRHPVDSVVFSGLSFRRKQPGNRASGADAGRTCF